MHPHTPRPWKKVLQLNQAPDPKKVGGNSLKGWLVPKIPVSFDIKGALMLMYSNVQSAEGRFLEELHYAGALSSKTEAKFYKQATPQPSIQN